jgi:hypothetical protein
MAILTADSTSSEWLTIPSSDGMMTPIVTFSGDGFRTVTETTAAAITTTATMSAVSRLRVNLL